MRNHLKLSIRTSDEASAEKLSEQTIDLLQHLNFCQRRNSDLQQIVIKSEVRSNHVYDFDEGHSDGDQ